MDGTSVASCSSPVSKVECELTDTRKDSGKNDAPSLSEQLEDKPCTVQELHTGETNSTKVDNDEYNTLPLEQNTNEYDTANIDGKNEANPIDNEQTLTDESSDDSKNDNAIKIDDGDTLSDIDDIKTDSSSADSEDSALGSLPPDGATNDKEAFAHDRSDASDSGIGTESNDCPEVTPFDLAEAVPTSNLQSSNIVAQNEPSLSEERKTEQPLKSSLKRKSSTDEQEPDNKKRRRNIRFENVTVYYFPRTQGFSCVPSQGGSTLGMEWEHTRIQKLTLAEHALEQRRIHRQLLQDLKNERNSIHSALLSSSDESDTEEESSDVSESELDLDSYYFLQPISTRQRRGLLRAAGVRKIEASEKDECRDIRTSRELCGCACKIVCEPDSCQCSVAGIKCQVDRLSFPCGCTKDGCKNTTGRIEFNPIRVKTHFIQTLMRLRQEKNEEESQVTRQWNIHTQGVVQSKDNMTQDYSFQKAKLELNFNSNYSNNYCNTNPVVKNNIPNNSHFGYSHDMSQRQLNQSNNLCLEQPSAINNYTECYTSNILQGKGPPFLTETRFDNVNNLQVYPCDYNYSYPQNDCTFQGLQTFSASSFEEFAHNSQMSMYSHYGQGYMPDYTCKPNTNATEHIYQCGDGSYLYKNEGIPNEVNKDYICNPVPKPYHVDTKTAAIENDENWFSHKTLFNLDSDQTVKDASSSQCESQLLIQQSDSVVSTENLGELIKKTMVESVNL